MCTDCKRPLVVIVEQARIVALLVQILVWNQNDEMASGPNEAEPLLESDLWILHVLQHVRGEHEIKRTVHIAADLLSVSMYAIETLHIRRDGIVTATDVDSIAL
jgi:hypothetical protein